ncbi:hypothetical protein EPA93_10600 [Ktedonosporobacter rubrisoli]|uniref:MaoC-like domain-containing protein n=1 Tax=Ktedonosporobacter rubrisoli TaxID=2509675 RepID=A0A4P6JMG9_KTERU|nr:MaoC family dehydratase [Ktedonosporobacter rubrisoli]QBD76435.1 hypothetical protein EPA93_10600 [Ktedonosporobacter rubrisoli]
MSQDRAQEPQRKPICVGEHIVRQISLTREEIANFATLCGDLNPLHHDENYARQTRFGGIIACGPQVTSLMMGLVATYFSQGQAMLGLEFNFRFLKAVKAEDTITIDWEITSVEPKASLQGDIVSLAGVASNLQGQTVIAGKGKVLVMEKL